MEKTFTPEEIAIIEAMTEKEYAALLAYIAKLRRRNSAEAGSATC